MRRTVKTLSQESPWKQSRQKRERRYVWSAKDCVDLISRITVGTGVAKDEVRKERRNGLYQEIWLCEEPWRPYRRSHRGNRVGKREKEGMYEVRRTVKILSQESPLEQSLRKIIIVQTECEGPSEPYHKNHCREFAKVVGCWTLCIELGEKNHFHVNYRRNMNSQRSEEWYWVRGMVRAFTRRVTVRVGVKLSRCETKFERTASGYRKHCWSWKRTGDGFHQS